MKNKVTFAIAALTAAGFTAGGAAADETSSLSKKDSFFGEVEKLYQSLNREHTFTLAQHQSHASHASHGSHVSHRSYYKPPPVDDDITLRETTGVDLASSRNDRSTPSVSVLPSSPAISKKLKTLKGNSPSFERIVTQSQLALLARGYGVGVVHGKLDASTRASIFKFQSKNGFAPDGKLTPEVLTALNVSAQ